MEFGSSLDLLGEFKSVKYIGVLGFEKRIAQCSLPCSMFDFDFAVAVLELLLPCLISRREEAGRERLSEMKVTGREEAGRERLSEMMYREREVETI
ncbi:hypothetical protein Dimus_037501, partial [Dionaea muscipula]